MLGSARAMTGIIVPAAACLALAGPRHCTISSVTPPAARLGVQLARLTRIGDRSSRRGAGGAGAATGRRHRRPVRGSPSVARPSPAGSAHRADATPVRLSAHRPAGSGAPTFPTPAGAAPMAARRPPATRATGVTRAADEARSATRDSVTARTSPTTSSPAPRAPARPGRSTWATCASSSPHLVAEEIRRRGSPYATCTAGTTSTASARCPPASTRPGASIKRPSWASRPVGVPRVPGRALQGLPGRARRDGPGDEVSQTEQYRRCLHRAGPARDPAAATFIEEVPAKHRTKKAGPSRRPSPSRRSRRSRDSVADEGRRADWVRRPGALPLASPYCSAVATVEITAYDDRDDRPVLTCARAGSAGVTNVATGSARGQAGRKVDWPDALVFEGVDF